MEDLDNTGRPHNVRIRGLPESAYSYSHRPLQQSFGPACTCGCGDGGDPLCNFAKRQSKISPPGISSVDCKLKRRDTQESLEQNTAFSWGRRYTYLPGSIQHHLTSPKISETPALQVEVSLVSASTQGRKVSLGVPENPQLFCNTLGIPMIDDTNWYA